MVSHINKAIKWFDKMWESLEWASKGTHTVKKASASILFTLHWACQELWIISANTQGVVLTTDKLHKYLLREELSVS